MSATLEYNHHSDWSVSSENKNFKFHTALTTSDASVTGPSTGQALFTTTAGDLTLNLYDGTKWFSVLREDYDETISGLYTFSNVSGLLTNVIGERTAAAGVTVDGVLLKDGGAVLLDDSAVNWGAGGVTATHISASDSLTVALDDSDVLSSTTLTWKIDGGTVGSLTSAGLRLGAANARVTTVLDEDDMVSDSATALATQQSIKAYVDSAVTAEDLDFAGDSGTGSVDLDSQTFTIATSNSSLVTSAASQTLTVSLAGVLEDLDTLGAASTDGEFIVATAAGAFTYESGNTARTSLGLGTGDTPQFTGIELGHASDSTITRVSAGQLAVEGTNIAMSGGAFHDGFSDFVADEHIAHSGVTLTAGSGLTGGGTIAASRTFNVGAGTGIAVNADDVALSAASLASLALADTALQNIVEDTTPQLGAALDGQGYDLTNLGVVFLTEQAAAEIDVAGKGQLWVKTAIPNTLWFTDDAGTDFPLGLFTAAQESKLNGIESGADVTDTVNVTAAGALMDSEVDADLKTFSLPASTTISTFGATLVDDADAATARATLDVDQAGTDNSTDVTLAGTGTYLSIAGQEITVDPITESDISDLGSYLTDIVSDTTPQLGGTLDGQGNDLSSIGDMGMSGDLTVSGTGTSSFAGSLAIGTTSASSILHVQSANPLPRFVHTNSANYSGLVFYENTTRKGSVYSIGSAFGTANRRNNTEIASDSGDITLWPGLSEKARFTSGGNVLIGTTTDSGYKLRVNGTGYFDGDVTFAGQIISTKASGAPITVTSTTICTNLNADFLDGNHASAFATSGHSHSAYLNKDGSVALTSDWDAGASYGITAAHLNIDDDGVGNQAVLQMDSNRTVAGAALGSIQQQWNGTEVSRIQFVAGADDTNKDDGVIKFWTAAGGSLSTAMTIEQDGSVSVSGTVDGRDVATDGSKLDGIEALADVTDTANVTAAGALMDSEVDADLKTLALPASTTISAFGATLVDDADQATAQATLGVDPAGTDNSTDVTLAGTGTYLSIAGQEITVDQLTESDISDLGSYLTDIVSDTTPQLGGALDGQGNDLTNLGVVFLTEQAAAEADVAGKGQLWVKTATPNQLWFTDDAGTDFRPLFVGGNVSDLTNDAGYLTGITGEPLSDLSDVTITSIGSGELLKWNGSAWINNTLAEAGISATGHVHAASDVTSGTFSDARIAESNVTQHEGAIDHDALTNFSAAEHFTVGSIDHGSITGLGDDDHTQYALADGTRAFTGSVTINSPGDLTVSGTGTSSVAGSLAIGTTIASSILHVQSANPLPRFVHTNSANYSGLVFYENTTRKGSVYSIGSAFGTANRRNNTEIVSDSGDITLWPGLSEKARFTSGGNVLIGTTTDGGYKLRVNGTGYFDGDVTTAGELVVDGVGTSTFAGPVAVTGNLSGTTISTPGQVTISTVSGAPLIVNDSTVCANLNADLLDGNHASAFSLSGHAHTNLNASTAFSSGQVPIADGGTGQATQQAAFDALSPLDAEGDILYRNAAGNGTKLSVGSARKSLISSGTVPTWDTLDPSDIGFSANSTLTYRGGSDAFTSMDFSSSAGKFLQVDDSTKLQWASITASDIVLQHTSVNDANDTAVDADTSFFFHSLSADRTLNLPASPTTGRIYFIAKDNSAKNLIVDPAGAVTISNAATFTIPTVSAGITVLFDGTNYQIVGRYQA